MKNAHFLALGRELLITLHTYSFYESLELVKEVYNPLVR